MCCAEAGATAAAPAQGALSRPEQGFWYNYTQNFDNFATIKDAINNKFLYGFNNTTPRN